MAIEYEQTIQKEIEDQVRHKYQASIDELKRLGFEELCFYTETISSLGTAYGLAGLLGALSALSNEVAGLGSDLRLSLFHLVLVSKVYAVYAFPFGLGVKFYTGFNDGTCVISTNFESQQITAASEKLYKFARPRSIEAAWLEHQSVVDKFRSEGKMRKQEVCFDDYLELVRREDSYLLRPGAEAQRAT